MKDPRGREGTHGTGAFRKTFGGGVRITDQDSQRWEGSEVCEEEAEGLARVVGS